jgi:hypothetical protein
MFFPSKNPPILMTCQSSSYLASLERSSAAWPVFAGLRIHVHRESQEPGGFPEQLVFVRCTVSRRSCQRLCPVSLPDLQRGEAAHFLVGSTAPDYEADPLAVCNVIQTLKLALPSESAMLTLPFAARICADVDVSVWRQSNVRS